ncbi:GNAT family N-acetyltransferase [Profundibacter amoris]|uniref:N-acetyltransferase n=1 Tax=Profundibacter amoris TaxID=2171755 RepID=A0A347UG58_9RHOB|nr:GNAT family N-acetyltransferase [Profundibacter amoris]AXX97836.1 N-acetyltransferase [Profundibacter amoris]
MRLEQIINLPVIDTERFTLRPLRKSDAGLLELYSSDERIARSTTSIPHPLPPGTTEAFIARVTADDRREDVWVLDGSAHGHAELLGVIGLTCIERGQAEIGYWIAPAFWNTGYASQAVNALIDANPKVCKTIFAEVFQDNPASARVLTNAGFEYIGDAESFSVARDATVATWTYIRKMDEA